MNIFQRYLFRELLGPFAINMIFFTFVFLMARILDITNMVVNYNISVGDVVKLLVLFIPYFLMFVIPIAVMISVLLTFMRLSGDNEIVACKTTGVSLYGLVPPVAVFCLLAFAFSLVMTVYASPMGRTAIKEHTLKMAASNVDLGLKARTFNDSFDGVMLYVNQIDTRDKILIDVFIEDQRTEDTISTVVAPRGKLFTHPDGLVTTLRLFNGSINRVELENNSVHHIVFDTYDITLDLSQKRIEEKKKRKNQKEMTVSELRHYLNTHDKKGSRRREYAMELHQRFSIPFACLALGLLAVSLGIQTQSTKRSYGLGLALFFFLVYFLLMSAGYLLGKVGIIPPAIAMWSPTVIIGALGGYLLNRTANERPFVAVGSVGSLAKRISGFIRKIRKKAA